jgi:hypothetical protein
MPVLPWYIFIPLGGPQAHGYSGQALGHPVGLSRGKCRFLRSSLRSTVGMTNQNNECALVGIVLRILRETR